MHHHSMNDSKAKITQNDFIGKRKQINCSILWLHPNAFSLKEQQPLKDGLDGDEGKINGMENKGLQQNCAQFRKDF